MVDNGWTEAPTLSPLNGDEPFVGIDAQVSDFWRYAMSDLRMNNVRGYLAEFLVAKAVGATGTRIEWDAHDVLTPDGIKVEVKSGGYLQAWDQASLSRVSFGRLSGRTWTPQDGQSSEATFNADVYVFCVQIAKSHAEYNRLDVGQWEFYVMSRRAIESRNFKSISLSALQLAAGGVVGYENLAERISEAGNEESDA